MDRHNGLGLEEWVRVAAALRSCERLEEVVDFGWSRAALLPGICHLCLSGAGLGDTDAAVLAALLPRAARTLVSVRLG